MSPIVIGAAVSITTFFSPPSNRFMARYRDVSSLRSA